MKMQLGPRRPLVFVISAPSGGGKTTLVQEVIQAFPDDVERVCTCTTRQPRASEVHGRDYWFITEAEFLEKERRGEFLESTTTYGYRYGTLKASVRGAKKIVVLVIDVKGALAVKKEMPVVSIFIQPPSINELEARIRGRKEDGEADVQKRLAAAKEELTCVHAYDYVVVNDDFSVAMKVIQSIIIAESFRREHG